MRRQKDCLQKDYGNTQVKGEILVENHAVVVEIKNENSVAT